MIAGPDRRPRALTVAEKRGRQLWPAGGRHTSHPGQWPQLGPRAHDSRVASCTLDQCSEFGYSLYLAQHHNLESEPPAAMSIPQATAHCSADDNYTLTTQETLPPKRKSSRYLICGDDVKRRRLSFCDEETEARPGEARSSPPQETNDPRTNLRHENEAMRRELALLNTRILELQTELSSLARLSL